MDNPVDKIEDIKKELTSLREIYRSAILMSDPEIKKVITVRIKVLENDLKQAKLKRKEAMN